MDVVAKNIRFYKLDANGNVVQKFRGLVSLGDIGMTKSNIDTDDFDKEYMTKTGGKPNIEDIEINTKIDPISHGVIIADCLANEDNWYGVEYPEGVKDLSCKVKGNVLSWRDTGFTGNSLLNTVFTLGINDYDEWMPPEYKQVTGITPASTEVSITGLAQTSELAVTFAPVDATDKDLFVASSNTAIATVAVTDVGEITITSVAAGSCVVTIISADGGFVATVDVTVKAQ